MVSSSELFPFFLWRLYLFNTAWKVSVFGLFLVRIFLHSDWIRRDTENLSVFTPYTGKYGPEKLRIRALFMQCKFFKLLIYFSFSGSRCSRLPWLSRKWGTNKGSQATHTFCLKTQSIYFWNLWRLLPWMAPCWCRRNVL